MFAPSTFKNQTVIVTGGGTGIGLAIARRFGELGAQLVLASRSPGHLTPASETLRAEGMPAIAVETDVRDPAQVDRMLDRALEAFGRVDILVNNAAGNFVCRAEDLSPNGWNAVIGIVLNGTFYCSRAVGRHMIARGGGGAIVSILANYVWTGSPGTIHSAAAKAGVMSITQTLAVEWARHRIRVNAVAPGPIASPGAAKQLWPTPEAEAQVVAGVPLGRWGRPEEVADAVAYLASPMAGYITGETLTIDGGAWIGGGRYDFLR